MNPDVFPVACAWCGSVSGFTSVPNSRGICPQCYERVLGVPLLSSEQLDALPFGVIKLDSKGVVLSYNQAEGALSHRRPLDVVGRNFFTDIAPCTQVREFSGRFHAFLSSVEQSVAFSFSFSFPHGSTDVHIVLLRSDSGSVFVTVSKGQR